MPPTRITSSMSVTLTPASLIAMRHGSIVRSISSSTSASSLARVSLMFRCFGPDASAVMYGRLMSVCVLLDSSILAFSAASFRRCSASTSLRQVDALFLLELGDDVVDDALVEVLAAEEGVAVGRQHFELLLAVDVGDLDDRDVEGAAAEVVDGDLAVALAVLVEAEGQRGRGRLVDDALDVQAGDAAGVLGGLALAVVEVGRHRDHGLGHFLAEVVLGGLLHLAQHFGADLRRRELLAAHLDPGVAVVGRRRSCRASGRCPSALPSR